MSVYDAFMRKRIMGVTVYTPYDFDYSFFKSVQMVWKSSGWKSKHKPYVKNIMLSFDIETTNYCDDVPDLTDKDVYERLYGIRLKYTDDIKMDIADFETSIRRRYLKKIRLSKSKGIPIDTAYMELNEYRPDLFPDNIINPSDQLLQIIKILDENTPPKTSGEDVAFMYVWMLGINYDKVIIGRTWADFRHCLKEIKKNTYVPEGKENYRYKIWVHNLSFEFQFLKGIYHFNPEDVFIIDGRRILKSTILDTFEFCCSYLQSNMSLKLLTEKYNATHIKQSGEDYDYFRIRYPWTELTDEELTYCICDVIGLNEAMYERMKQDNDTLFTIPYTSTGYVRRDVKKSMRTYPRDVLRDRLPDYETYELLEEAFRGGDTHANRFYANRIIDNVVSYDRESSYPDVMCNDLFPLGAWRRFDTPSLHWLNTFVSDFEYALLITAVYKGVLLRQKSWGNPYIPKHKCRSIKNGIFDNGRVLYADEIVMVCTDIDYRIIEETYNYDITVLDIRYSFYGRLPEEIRDSVKKYFKNKTELKGVEDQIVLYEKSKALLNSIYGMCAQKPVKQRIDFLVDEVDQFQLQTVPRDELYAKQCKSAFLSYAWGVWVTAWARYRLYEGVKIAGRSFIYADTDSVKFVKDNTIIKAFEEYNKARIASSELNGAYATDIKGKTHYMGVYELDGTYDKFITLGAKKYGYEQGDKLGITIAGVNKKKGAEELRDLGGLKALKQGTRFTDAGGLEAVYNDHCFFNMEIEGKIITVTDNVCLKPSTYTLGLTEEYERLLYQEQRSKY